MATLPWEVWAIMVPLVGASLSFLFRGRLSVVLGLISAVVTALVVLGISLDLVAHGAARYHLGGWGAPLGIDLYTDGLSGLMIGMTTVVGVIVSVYAAGYFKTPHLPIKGEPAEMEVDERAQSQFHKARYFWPLWLFLWASMHALFLSADLFNIYVTLEILGLASVALIALAGGVALTAAMRYLLVTMAGSLMYLLGTALLYSAYGTLNLADLTAVVESGPVVWAAMSLMTVGLLLKTALFPLHFWLPPAHANAPAPVSAVLSALVVKASFYLLLRLWLVVFPALTTEAVAHVLGILGASAIVWGSIQALRQERIKMLVAYSTVAQLGYLFVMFPLALAGVHATGDASPGTGEMAWRGGAYFALSHAFAKSAMFLAAGTVAVAIGHDRIDSISGLGRRLPVTFFAFGLAGINLMGLPPSGGYLSKWLFVTAAIETGSWVYVVVIHVGGLLAAAYVFRIIQKAFSSGDACANSFQPVPITMQIAPFVLALLSIGLGLWAVEPLALLEIGAPFGESPATESPYITDEGQP